MIFADPPAVTRHRSPTSKWLDIANSLKQNPSQYGLVGNFSLGVGSHIRKGKYAALVPSSVKDPEDRAVYMEKHWHVATRRSETDRADVYLAWVGGGCDCESCQ